VAVPELDFVAMVTGVGRLPAKRAGSLAACGRIFEVGGPSTRGMGAHLAEIPPNRTGLAIALDRRIEKKCSEWASSRTQRQTSSLIAGVQLMEVGL